MILVDPFQCSQQNCNCVNDSWQASSHMNSVKKTGLRFCRLLRHCCPHHCFSIDLKKPSCWSAFSFDFDWPWAMNDTRNRLCRYPFRGRGWWNNNKKLLPRICCQLTLCMERPTETFHSEMFFCWPCHWAINSRNLLHWNGVGWSFQLNARALSKTTIVKIIPG